MREIPKMKAMRKENVVGWFEIYVDDMDRAKAFYSKVFKLGEFMDLSDPDWQMFAFPWVENAPFAAGALSKAKGMKAGKGGTVVYFNCDDCALEESRVVESGGKVLKPKFSIGQYGFISIVEDTEGNMIGLNSKK